MDALKERVLQLPLLERSIAARQFVKFAIVGASNTLCDYALYIVLTRGWLGFQLHFVSAQFLAFLGAMLNSYILNKRWTFRHSDSRHHIHLTKFFLVNVMTLLLNEALLLLLVGRLGVYDLLAKGIAIIPVTLWNFAANKYWTFRQALPPQPLSKP